MNLIDTHCHLTYEPFAEIGGVIQRSRDAGVTGWITVGTDIKDSGKAVALSGKFENMFAAVAIHPHHAKSADKQAIDELKRIARNKKVVAIGETGLDFHYDFSSREKQQDSFVRHLEIAAELNLPVVIHSREAFDETMKILDSHRPDLKGVVFHCFSESVEQAKAVLEKGWFISLTGVVTFKNAEKTRQVAKFVPIDRLMLETDAPYLSPEPLRKQKVNEPALLIHTARFLAGLRGETLDNFASAVTAASSSFFGLH